MAETTFPIVFLTTLSAPAAEIATTETETLTAAETAVPTIDDDSDALTDDRAAARVDRAAVDPLRPPSRRPS